MKKENPASVSPEKFAPARSESLEGLLPFFRNWEMISQYQKDISQNLRDAFWGNGYQKSVAAAPTNLWQSILPSSFSLIQFTKEMRGNPVTESRIISEVAGYGSQLGTILDFLEVLEKKYPLEATELQDEEDVYKVLKFKALVKKIKKAKESV